MVVDQGTSITTCRGFFYNTASTGEKIIAVFGIMEYLFLSHAPDNDMTERSGSVYKALRGHECLILFPANKSIYIFMGVPFEIKKVAEQSHHVRIDRGAVARLVEERFQDFKAPSWDSFHHFHDGGEKTVAYLLALDTINFCFWPPPGRPRWEIQSRGQRLSGYYALAAALRDAVESGTPLDDAEYLARMSLNELRRILGGQGELQLLRERGKALNELGRVLLESYGGKAHRMVEAARGSAVQLAGLLADELESFRDVAQYRGTEVFFYKRAQIFAADLHGAFQGRSWGAFHDMDQLTAFADYKLPQVLRHLGVLHYSRNLSRKVDNNILIEAGSEEEVEIRANTITAVEMIRSELASMGKELRSFEIDGLLWNLGQKKEFRRKPYHKTVTIFY